MNDPEDARVERKESAKDIDKIRRTVCAFANDLGNSAVPSIVFVGLCDDGSPSGKVRPEDFDRLANLRGDGSLQPMPSLEVERLDVDGHAVLAVIVHPSRALPVRYEGVVWVRVGATTQRATREDELRLTERNRAAILPFDAQPLQGAELADLDLDFLLNTYIRNPSVIAPHVLAENQRSIEQQLASLRLTDLAGAPTPTGLLVAGLSPTSHLPGAYISFQRYASDELNDDILDSADFHGTVTSIVRESEAKLRALLETPVEFSGRDVEARFPTYPFDALQQYLRNAVMHRTYEYSNSPTRIRWFADRLEIMSPGGPFGIVHADAIRQGGVSDYRNPNLAVAMKNLGLVQQFGVGLTLAKSRLAANGNPPPEFEINENFVLVRVRKRP